MGREVLTQCRMRQMKFSVQEKNGKHCWQPAQQTDETAAPGRLFKGSFGYLMKCGWVLTPQIQRWRFSVSVWGLAPIPGLIGYPQNFFNHIPCNGFLSCCVEGLSTERTNSSYGEAEIGSKPRSPLQPQGTGGDLSQLGQTISPGTAWWTHSIYEFLWNFSQQQVKEINFI